MSRVNNNLVLVVLRKMATQSSTNDSYIDRFVNEMKDPSSAFSYVSASKMLHEYIAEKSNQETADFLFERFEQYKLIKHPITNHDISTYDGFMSAVDEVMEMFSGAAMGGPMSGAGSNASINATGMAGIDKPLSKKRKSINKILNRRL